MAKKTKLERIKEKAAEIKLSWEPIRDAVDRSDKILHLITQAGLAYYGYKVNEHWTGAITALLGYRLALSENMVSGAAGVTVLTALGVLQLTKPYWSDPSIYLAQGEKPPIMGKTPYQYFAPNFVMEK